MTVQTAIRLDPAQLDKLRELSKDGRPMIWHIRKALDQYLGETKPKQEIKPAAKPRFDPIEYGRGFGDLHQEGWQAWVDKRKEMKKPISQAAAKSQVAMLIKYMAEEQRRIIWESIKNDYQGLFEPKDKTSDKPKQSLSERSAAATTRILAHSEDALNLLGQDDPFIRSQVGIEGRGIPYRK